MTIVRKDIEILVARSVFILVAAVVVLSGNRVSIAIEEDWPREIRVPEGKIVIYQPQLESFEGNTLTGRAAVSVTPKDAAEPTFGAVWMSARVSTDRNTRMMTLLDVSVTNTRFPKADPAKLEKLSSILEAEIPRWNLEISLDRILAMLELVEKEQAAATGLKSTPPKIIFSTQPAMLVTIDGEPKLDAVEKSNVKRVVNTPFLILSDPATGKYYLYGGNRWFSAFSMTGPWTAEPNLPSSVRSVAELNFGVNPESEKEGKDEPVPQIIVATKPTELIQSAGQPKYSMIGDTDLMYMDNTESDVFVEIESQRYYVLLSGRWFAAASLKGPWSHVASDKLPADFAKIPEGSAKGHVLAQIAGTRQAEEAVLDTYIPQTASIDRGKATLAVEYDGKPKFEKIEGTDMYYAVNTTYSVIRIGKNSKYYACHEAVWFAADNPVGPWVVCVSVPQVIYTIPPSCPIYNVKYVYVYESTPTVVYVGYTTGYVGCYVHGHTVVYGTGHHYHGWHGHAYYARPHTWGFAVRYNPYTGNWGFAVGRRGHYGGAVAVGRRAGGWWGPAGYRDVDVSRTVTTPRGTWSSDLEIDRGFGETEIKRDVTFEPNENLYDKRDDRADRGGEHRDDRGERHEERPGGREPVRTQEGRSKTAQKPVTTQTENNVFADKDGNVHRKTDSGWQQRDSSGWPDTGKSKPDTGSRRSTTQSSSDRSRSSLESQHTARNRGASRTSSYQSYRSSGSSGARSSAGSRGGSRSGGGGRR